MVHSLFNNSICVSISLKRITSHITASLKKSTLAHTHRHRDCLSWISPVSGNNTNPGYGSQQQQQFLPSIVLKLYTISWLAACLFMSGVEHIFEQKIFVWEKNVGILMSCLKSLFLSLFLLWPLNLQTLQIHTFEP